MNLTGKQVRAARALAGWDRPDLAARVGMSLMTIQNIELESKRPKQQTIDKIVAAFDEVGIEFTENQGVRCKPSNLEVFEGVQRFDEFMDYMYGYLDRHGGDVCISIKDERYLQRTRKNIEAHRAKMFELVNSGKVKGRILAAEGELKSGWAELRRQHVKSDMPQVSFFAFGDNLALISFDNASTPYVVLHKTSPFAAAYKNAFEVAWERAGEES